MLYRKLNQNLVLSNVMNLLMLLMLHVYLFSRNNLNSQILILQKLQY